MSSTFAGVSVLADGELCPSTESSVVTSTNCGYHLLVVQDYSRTKRGTPAGFSICSRPFMVGRHEWCIEYYPNGCKKSCANFISLFVGLRDEDAKEPVKAKYNFSFIDEVEKHKPAYISEIETFRFHYGCSRGYHRFMKRDVLEQSANLMGDCFTIRCDIMVCDTEDAGGNKVLLSEIDHHLNKHILLQTKVGADVTFEVSGEIFSAHRCVLAARSEVFMAQLFGPMKEGTTTSSVIQIKDMEAKVFRALLSFIYTDSFPEMEEDSMDEDETEAVEGGQEEEAREYVQWLQDLLVAADRYDLQRLKFICEKQLSERIGVSSVASTLALAEQRQCRRLKKTCLKFIQVQSPLCLQKVMATDDWEPLITTYPSVLNELIAKLASNQK